MILVKNLFHSYTNNEMYAVEDVNFIIQKGEIFGFLGPSGAGKSTTQNILTAYLIFKADKRALMVKMYEKNLKSSLTSWGFPLNNPMSTES